MSGKTLGEIKPAPYAQQAINKAYCENGSNVVFVDGKEVAAVTSFRRRIAKSALNPIKTDARLPAKVFLRSVDDSDEGNILEITVESRQPGNRELLIGYGAAKKNQAESNILRTVGDPTADPFTEITHAHFYLLKIDTGDFEIARLMYPNMSIEATDYSLQYYDAATKSCSNISDDVGASVTIADAAIGNIEVTGATPPTTIVYDAAEIPEVELGSKTIAPVTVDPNLKDGDTAVMIGIAYKWFQLANSGDFSFTDPNEERNTVFLDVARAMGDTGKSDIWLWQSFLRAEPLGLADTETDGRRPDPNQETYRFKLLPVDDPLSADHYMHAETWIVATAA